MISLSTVIEVASSNPITVPCFCRGFFRYFFNLFIYLKIKVIIISKPFGLLNIALMKANIAYLIELMNSVASRICVFVFDNIPFDGQFI